MMAYKCYCLCDSAFI